MRGLTSVDFKGVKLGGDFAISGLLNVRETMGKGTRLGAQKRKSDSRAAALERLQ